MQLRALTGPSVQSQNQLPQSSALLHVTLVAPSGRALPVLEPDGVVELEDRVAPASLDVVAPPKPPPPPDEHAASASRNEVETGRKSTWWPYMARRLALGVPRARGGFFATARAPLIDP